MEMILATTFDDLCGSAFFAFALELVILSAILSVLLDHSSPATSLVSVYRIPETPHNCVTKDVAEFRVGRQKTGTSNSWENPSFSSYLREMGFGHSHSHSTPQDHSHGHSHGHHAHGSNAHGIALARAFVVTLLFAGVEVVGGYLSNSLALLSDSVHMLMDSGALALALAVTWIARRKAPRGYTYGYQRVEILGALLSGLLVWLLTGFLIYESVERFQNPPDVKGDWVFWIASIGLAANLCSLFFLHRSSKENLNVRSAYLHVLTDSLGSVGAMIAGGVIYLTGLKIVDPIITVLLSLLMLWSSWSLVKEAVGVLMERSPGHLQLDAIETALRSLDGVREVHDLHVWTLSSGRVSLSVHLIVEAAAVASGEVLHEATHRLEEEFGISHTTIQMEPEGSETAEHCSPC